MEKKMANRFPKDIAGKLVSVKWLDATRFTQRLNNPRELARGCAALTMVEDYGKVAAISDGVLSMLCSGPVDDGGRFETNNIPLSLIRSFVIFEPRRKHKGKGRR